MDSVPLSNETFLITTLCPLHCTSEVLKFTVRLWTLPHNIMTITKLPGLMRVPLALNFYIYLLTDSSQVQCCQGDGLKRWLKGARHESTFHYLCLRLKRYDRVPANFSLQTSQTLKGHFLLLLSLSHNIPLKLSWLAVMQDIHLSLHSSDVKAVVLHDYDSAWQWTAKVLTIWWEMTKFTHCQLMFF